MSNKNERAQKKSVELALSDMLEWYASNSGGKMPDHIAEDRKAYGGKVLRWLEPLLPNVDNPMLVEEALGDSWTLSMEPIQRKTQVFVP